MGGWIQETAIRMSLHRGDPKDLVYYNHLISIRTYHFRLITLMMVARVNNIAHEGLLIMKELTVSKIMVSSEISELEGRKARIPKIKGSK